MDPHKDGVTVLPPTVYANNWREAVGLASPGVTFRCGDGWTVTFGTKKLKPHSR
jgi:hypothetical protein